MNLITGMHRSGSSILSKLLIHAGVDFGDPDGFYPADRWNPDGYFEQRDILELNMALVNGSFGKLGYALLPSSRRITERAKKYEPEINRMIEVYSGLTVKENRFCLTLPAWLYFGLEVEMVLVCLRDPNDVVSSLKRRNRLPKMIGYELWLKHYTRLMHTIKESGIPYRVVEYERLIDQDLGFTVLMETSKRLGKEIELSKAKSILEENLRPQVGPRDQKPIPLQLAEMYGALKDQAI